LIVQRPLQSIDGICFCVDWEELTLELLLKVSPGLNWEDASVYFLAKEVLRLFCSPFILEEGKGPEDFLLVAAELLQDQVQIQRIGVEESLTRTLFTREVWERREFWPCSLFRQSGRNRGRGSNQRGRHRYWRWSDSWGRGRASHKLSDLL